MADTAQVASDSIDSATTVGMLCLTVGELERSIAFYTTAIGLRVMGNDDGIAVLGVGSLPLVALVEQPGAGPWPRGGLSYTGLYHFAILMPSRAALGRWLAHWLSLGLGIPGQGDHLVSEAFYLEDPDGHGIEIYRDRPRDEWQWDNGQVRMATDPVDIRGVLSEGESEGLTWDGMPEGTEIGHIHLQVSDIAQSEAFCHDILGFDVVARMPTALFVSAGGYHHHIGMNTWHSRGQQRPPAGVVALQWYTIALPTEGARDATAARVERAGIPIRWVDGFALVRDPSDNIVVLSVGQIPDVFTATSLVSVHINAPR